MLSRRSSTLRVSLTLNIARQNEADVTVGVQSAVFTKKTTEGVDSKEVAFDYPLVVGPNLFVFINKNWGKVLSGESVKVCFSWREWRPTISNCFLNKGQRENHS